MTYSNTTPEAEDLVVKYFLADWGNTSPVFLEGENSKEPEDGSIEWCRLTIRHMNAGQETLGGQGERKFNRDALAIVQLFMPENQGKRLLSTRMQTVLTIFEGKRILGSSVRFNTVRPQERGQDKKWLSANVEAEFSYTERK